ncbi:MAG: transketolase [Synergistaceae bacterium]|nr:transketolase [Synergistaceae bacterium]
MKIKSEADESIIKSLEEKARLIRLGVIDALGVGNRGHLGGSMSCADIVASLYFYKMRHSPDNRSDPNRDRFIMSKGHSVLAQYAALAEAGYFDKSVLATTKSLGSLLQGHPERTTPGIEANTGSLGQGLSIGVGFALAGKLDSRDYRVYVIIGDGELAEGQIWEAAMAANHYGLCNLTAIVDMNSIQAMGKTCDRYRIDNIAGRFAAFGWKTFEIDGHDMASIVAALDTASAIRGCPSVIIARTVKGKGVSFAENTHTYHNNLLTAEDREKAIASIMSGGLV